MTSLKRKASQELSRNSIEAIEPIQGEEMFEAIKGLFWGVMEWFRGRGDLSHTDMSYSNIDVVADKHTQRAEAREDGSSAVRRKKIKSKNFAHRRTVSQHQESISINMDQKESLSEEELRARADAQWIPPAFGAPAKSVEQEVIVISDDEEEEDKPARPKSIADSLRPSRLPKFSPIRPQSMKPERRISTIPDNNSSLHERLADLLSLHDDKEDETGRSPFAISRRAQEKIKRDAEARKLKEKQERIRIAKERRLTRRDPPKRLVNPLGDKWETILREALHRARENGTLPITESQGGTPLHYKDFGTLLGRSSWLNDEIINTYIEWVVEAANEFANAEAKAFGEPVGKVPKFIAHNSFFYENLDKKGPSSTQRLMNRKKAPGASLLQVDTVFVPICRGSHWTVGVVRPIARTIEYFDSLQGSSSTFIRLMRGWLKFQLGPDYKEDEWKTPNTGCTIQMNGFDCGVFVCTNALCVALGVNPDCYHGSDMAMMRRNIAALLINKGFQGDFAWGLGVF
ncbi:hypothetical protein DSL72_007048 [Monilinia vaccinii-corymbosi]|uniref:Ubiquitin-like protease family profile domain-containing protein n=1 Tax=Monilinia vaccinii-corymbosi TaxID=61207 RepID=A0A8A3PM39_9HELO|nr:hypothetical protein DSL72_007048 [Monilinia vaccinii-corymbosi]